ncbi:MAG: hypothetical protein PHT07_15195 [Paludibacter sp.]|nr:hypothetical protein [Paludibacter sp.]
MNPNVRLALAAAGVFVIVVSANVVAESMYTNSKIGSDKKIFLAGTIIGVGAAFALAKFMKIKA